LKIAFFYSAGSSGEGKEGDDGEEKVGWENPLA
jgi:hypothetical protein